METGEKGLMRLRRVLFLLMARDCYGFRYGKFMRGVLI